MDTNTNQKTEKLLRTVLKTLDVSSEGKVSSEELGKVLVSLGRPLDEEARQNILNRHRGRVTSGLLREIAVLPVTNLGLVEEFVFSAAFSTFDQVR